MKSISELSVEELLALNSMQYARSLVQDAIRDELKTRDKLLKAIDTGIILGERLAKQMGIELRQEDLDKVAKERAFLVDVGTEIQKILDSMMVDDVIEESKS